MASEPASSPGRSPARLVRRVLAAALAILGAAVASPAAARGQPPRAGLVALELHPRVGDVVRMRLDQQVEVWGTARRGAGDTTLTVRTDLLVLTRSIVQRADADGATVLAITDSVLLFSTGRAGDWIDQTQRRLRGQRLRMRLAPDGALTMLDEGARAPVDAELRALVAQMPAMLPTQPVAVGGTWTRTMAIPLAGQPESRVAGELVTTFRLDSLGRNGELAYVSMNGKLRQSPNVEDAHGVHADLAGTVTGQILVDLRRGWVTDAITSMTVRSTLKPGAAGGPPMKFRMKVLQRLRAM